MTSDTEISKLLSYVLRHAPEELHVVLDAEGWTNFAELSGKVSAKLGVSEADIRRVIDENAKKRFTLEGGRIRAAQGHSVAVDLALVPKAPPEFLYHGTTSDAWSVIRDEGLAPMERNHVHLSPDPVTARAVAERRKGPHILLKVDTKSMAEKGYPFFQADNGVWLTAKVPPAYLSPITEV